MKRQSADLPDEAWEHDPQLSLHLQGGGALFNFQLQPDGPRRNWRNVLNRQGFQTRIETI